MEAVGRKPGIGPAALFFALGFLMNAGCGGGETSGTGGGAPAPPPCSPTKVSGSFTLSGKVTYDWIRANASSTEGSNKLDYSTKQARPARRVVVQAVDSCGNSVAQTTTNDSGDYSLTASGYKVKVRALAWLYTTGIVPDGTAPDNCNGANWDIRVVDNTSGKAQYALDSASFYTESATGVNLYAALTFTGVQGSGANPLVLTNRAAAPFALADTIVSELELVCQGGGSQAFPLLYVNWSVNNRSLSNGSKTDGYISTSHFTTENNIGNLYILGWENVDTDEYDDHVIAHEFGHYLENFLYRSDTIGGAHGLTDSLDPRVAFGEGFGNAISGMTFNDPVYVDTYGTGQNTGFLVAINQAPVFDDRGVYSERSVQYLLWKLYANNTNSYVKIHNILRNYQRTTPAFTSVQSFAAYYNRVYGGASENLQTLWTTNLGTPYDSLCTGLGDGAGGCSGDPGADPEDPFDRDGDIGAFYCAGCADPRKYQQDDGNTFTAPFWNLYRTLASAGNGATTHDQTNYGNYTLDTFENKFGAVRWYRYKGTGATATIAVKNLGGGVACTSDVLDMYVRYKGKIVAYDVSDSGSHAGCPTVSFSATNGEMYAIEVRGYKFTTPVSSWEIQVNP